MTTHPPADTDLIRMPSGTRPPRRPPVTDWQEWYRSRTTTAPAAAARVQSGDFVYVPVGSRAQVVVQAIVDRAQELTGVTITGLPNEDYGWFAPEMAGHITVNVLYASASTRAALANRIADYTPFPMYGAHKGLDEGREEGRPINVHVFTVSPPNEHGYVSLGNSVWDAKSCIARAELNIATVNPHTIQTYGDAAVHVSEIDWFVPDDRPYPDRTAEVYPPPEPWDAAICGYVSTLVHDGDVIQIGTGSTTGQLPRMGAFDQRHDLGYFGELTVPGTIDLVKKGIITSKYLKLHPGKFVTTTAGNSAEDRAYINNNPMFEFYAIDYIHDPRIIARNDNYLAINNALTVDLGGQIAASAIGPRIYSGTGGHFSFAMGAYLSHGGRYVCVLPATAVGGTVSRIVPQFVPGQIVTVPRHIADTVVTEYGIARLLNRSVRERAEALIAIAHPDFRAELRQQAQKLFWP